MANPSGAPSRLPIGPLAVEWRAHNVPLLRAGVEAWGDVTVRNAGTVSWRAPDESERGVWLSFHWLDRLGNAIIWEGQRAPLPHTIEPGDEVTVTTAIRGPMPPGPYRLAFDLVDEGRCWFAEVGNEPLVLDVDVVPRLPERTLSVTVLPGHPALVETTMRSLERQDEPVHSNGYVLAHLPAGSKPRQDWSRRVLDAHDDGNAAVGGSVRLAGMRFLGRSLRQKLRPWQPGFGRMPNWQLPLLCPSMTKEIQEWIPLDKPICGLPAVDMTSYAEPWLCDGRITIDLPLKAGQQADRLRDETRAQPQ